MIYSMTEIIFYIKLLIYIYLLQKEERKIG